MCSSYLLPSVFCLPIYYLVDLKQHMFYYGQEVVSQEFGWNSTEMAPPSTTVTVVSSGVA